MIRFDASKLTVEHVLVKSMTTALGGSIRIVDEVELERTGNEVLVKRNCPMAAIRLAAKVFKTSRFFSAIQCALVIYDGHVVSIELNQMDNDLRRADMPLRDGIWWSKSEDNVETVINRYVHDTSENEWYIDGKMIYGLPPVSCIDGVIANSGTRMSSDGKFYSYAVEAYKLQSMNMEVFSTLLSRQLLAFKTQSGGFVLTPPIWKSLDAVGTSQINLGDDAAEEDTTYQFDKIDSLLSVNLNFALSAAGTISKLFGYEKVAALRLPSLMIQLNTVNLPGVPKHIKSTFGIGMPFTYTMAWLIGLLESVDNITDLINFRGTLKYLTTKGIFFNSLLDVGNVYVDPKVMEFDVMTPDQAANNVGQVNVPIEYMTTLISSNDNIQSGTNILEAD